MTKKYTPEDITGLKLQGTPSEKLQATYEFCDVLNTFAAKMEKWRQRFENLGSLDAASIKLQAKMVAQVADPR